MGGDSRKKRGLAKIPGTGAPGDEGPAPAGRAPGAPPGAPPGPRAVPGAASNQARCLVHPTIRNCAPIGPLGGGSAGHAAGACASGRPASKAAAGGPPNWPQRAAHSPRGRDSPRQRLHSPAGEALKAAVREAVRLELAEFFGPRGELPPRSRRSRSSVGGSASTRSTPRDPPSDAPSRPASLAKGAWPLEPPEESEESVASDTNHEHDHFKAFTSAPSCPQRPDNSLATRLEIQAEDLGLELGGSLRLFVHLVRWMWELREPPRSGTLASFVGSDVFERVVQCVILCNCAFMLFAANDEMANYENPDPTLRYVGYFFTAFYMVEISLKLCVHRLYFFWNHDAGFNSFDFFLVASGLVDMIMTSGGSHVALRTARLLKVGKSLRAVRVISKFRNLRAILLSIYGSFETLIWSVLMLCVVFYLFSLIFVEQAASLLQDLVGQEVQEDQQLRVDYLITNFGDVLQGMLTLAMAALGGEDWGTPYYNIEECGFLAAACYLLFVAFTQIALINIITGIFVDSAMQNLAPGKEALARDLQLEKEAHMEELVNLCKEADADTNGKLSKEQFQDGLKRGRIPMLLQLIGLNRYDVERFFDVLSRASPSGAVEITSFARGCVSLAGGATSFDLQMLTVDMKGIQKQQAKDFRDMRRRLQRVEQQMEVVLPVSGGKAEDHMYTDSLLLGRQCSDEMDPV